jgi:hypothetical protein
MPGAPLLQAGLSNTNWRHRREPFAHKLDEGERHCKHRYCGFS